MAAARLARLRLHALPDGIALGGGRRRLGRGRSRSFSALGQTHGQRRWAGQPPWYRNQVARNLYSGPARRALSFSAFSRAVLRSARVPAGLGALGASSLAYLHYRLKGVSDYTRDVYDRTRDWCADNFTALRESMPSLSFPDLEGTGWLGSLSEQWENFKEEMRESLSSQNQNRSEQEQGTSEGSNLGAGVGGVSLGSTTLIDENERPQDQGMEQIMLLTLKMIEIRNLLAKLGQSEDCVLPSIVVIGSQSSGKSSVLEAIVGQEFLPKGLNMVTRRPLELTLINTKETRQAYGDIEGIRDSKHITDFGQIQRILTDLNLAVPEEQAISDDPIRMTIYSPTVPNLSLIDLPGYIQVQADDQPPELDEKIKRLCDRYISGNQNIVLAISAADVDLANSTALRASRRVDPRGIRTIGVITKLDLVSPEQGADLLKNNKYPLQLGYIGVICKTPTRSRFAIVGGLHDLTSQVIKTENDYLKLNSQHFKNLEVGVKSLQQKLQHVLEKAMSQSLDSAARAIRKDLEDTTYQFKVQYNERPLTAEAYLASTVDHLKQQFTDLSKKFGKNELQRIIKSALEFKVMDLLCERYYSDPRMTDLTIAQAPTEFWLLKLRDCASMLTRVGVGKLSTDLAARALLAEFEKIKKTSLKDNAFAQTKVEEAVRYIIESKRCVTVDQVENSVKPYKWGIEIDQREWNIARQSALALVEKEIQLCLDAFEQIQRAVGGSKRLNQVISSVPASEDISHGSSVFSADMLEAGRRAKMLKQRNTVLRTRLSALKSRQCNSLKNDYACPEIFLNAVAEKLTNMAILFLNIELLSEFYYQIPREIDDKLLHGLTSNEISRFAKESENIRRHIELQERKELLELALYKIESIQSAKRMHDPLLDLSAEETTRRSVWGFRRNR